MADGVFCSIDSGLHGPLVRHHLAVLAREEGRFDEAENHWRAVLAEHPAADAAGLPARLGLAELYLQQSRWPELETLLTELAPHAPLDDAVLRARLHLARKEYDTARPLLDDVISQAPQIIAPYVILSHGLLQGGDENAAEPLLRRIVEMDAGQAESWRNLAVLYRRRHRLREAIAAAQAGRLHCPHDADLLLLHGVLLHEGGDALNAETCLLGVLESEASDGTAQHRRTTARQHLISLYRFLDRHREADAHKRTLAVEAPELHRREPFAVPPASLKPHPESSPNGQIGQA